MVLVGKGFVLGYNFYNVIFYIRVFQLICIVLYFIIVLVVVRGKLSLVELFVVIQCFVFIKFIGLNQVIVNRVIIGGYGVIVVYVINICQYLVGIVFVVYLQQYLVKVGMLSRWCRIRVEVDVRISIKIKVYCLLLIQYNGFDNFVLGGLGFGEGVIL